VQTLTVESTQFTGLFLKDVKAT